MRDDVSLFRVDVPSEDYGLTSRRAGGGMGWRAGAKKIIVVAGDNPSAAGFAPGPIPDSVTGRNGASVSTSMFYAAESGFGDEFNIEAPVKDETGGFYGWYVSSYGSRDLSSEAEEETWMAFTGALVEGGPEQDYTPFYRYSEEFGPGSYGVEPRYGRFGTVGNLLVVPPGAADVQTIVDELVNGEFLIIGMFTGSDATVRTTFPDGAGHNHIAALCELTGSFITDGVNLRPAVIGLGPNGSPRSIEEVTDQLYAYVDELAGTSTKIDIGYLVDGSGSFFGNISLARESMINMLDLLLSDSRDMAAGYAYFGEFASEGSSSSIWGSSGSSSRPYGLLQTVLEIDSTDARDTLHTIMDDLTLASWGGGDAPESSLEAIYQIVTGVGLDGTYFDYFNGVPYEVWQVFESTSDPTPLIPYFQAAAVQDGSKYQSGEALVAGTYAELLEARSDAYDAILAELGNPDDPTGWYSFAAYELSQKVGVGYSYRGASGDIPPVSAGGGLDPVDSVVRVSFFSRSEATVLRLPLILADLIVVEEPDPIPSA